MKILSIGAGFVGKATFLLNTSQHKFNVFDINPDLCVPKNFILRDTKQYDLIFINLPTPMNIDGSCYTSLIEKYITDLNHDFIIIRSTIPIGFCDKYNVFFMPEFLTEKNWESDFRNNNIWYLGYPDQISLIRQTEMFCRFKNLIDSAYREEKITNNTLEYCPAKECELLKYTKNVFLSTKVSFFNEIYELAKKFDIDYDMIVKHLQTDKRIGKTHMQVPGVDGKFGYSGTCFPKDTISLYNQMLKNDIQPIILEANLFRNEFIDRKERDWLNNINRSCVKIDKPVYLLSGYDPDSEKCQKLLSKAHVICLCLSSVEDRCPLVSENKDISDKGKLFILNIDPSAGGTPLSGGRGNLFFPRLDKIYYSSDPNKSIYENLVILMNLINLAKHYKINIKHNEMNLFETVIKDSIKN